MHEQDPKIRRRTAARLAAVQILYEQEMAGESIADLITNYLKERADQLDDPDIVYLQPDKTLLRDLLNGYEKDKETLDGLLRGVLPEDWPYDRVDMVLRLIVLCGIYEMLRHVDLAPAIIITEYADLTYGFYGEEEVAFTHGMLNGVATTLGRK